MFSKAISQKRRKFGYYMRKICRLLFVLHNKGMQIKFLSPDSFFINVGE